MHSRTSMSRIYTQGLKRKTDLKFYLDFRNSQGLAHLPKDARALVPPITVLLVGRGKLVGLEVGPAIGEENDNVVLGLREHICTKGHELNMSTVLFRNDQYTRTNILRPFSVIEFIPFGKERRRISSSYNIRSVPTTRNESAPTPKDPTKKTHLSSLTNVG